MNSRTLDGLWKHVDASRATPSEPVPRVVEHGEDLVVAPGRGPLVAGASDGVLLGHRFDASIASGRRAWLQVDGVRHRAAVWLDDCYLGEVDTPYAPRTFEITSLLGEQREHRLALEVAPAAPGTGVERAVRILETGPVRISRLRARCTESGQARATLALHAELLCVAPTRCRVRTTVSPVDGGASITSTTERSLAAGANRLRWEVTIEEPSIWWPAGLGPQPLSDVTIDVAEVTSGVASDEARFRTGFRTFSGHGSALRVNEVPLFLRCYDFGAAPIDLDAVRSADANAVLARELPDPETLDVLDSSGILLVQVIPVGERPGDAQQSARFARQAVEVLGHRAALAAWARPSDPDDRLAILHDSAARAVARHDGTRPLVAPVGARKRRPLVERVRSVLHAVERRPGLRLADEASLDVARRDHDGAGVVASTRTATDGALDAVTAIVTPAGGRPRRLAVHVVNDGSTDLQDVVLTARITSGGATMERRWVGDVAARTSSLVTTIATSGPVEVELTVASDLGTHRRRSALGSGR